MLLNTQSSIPSFYFSTEAEGSPGAFPQHHPHPSGWEEGHPVFGFLPLPQPWI